MLLSLLKKTFNIAIRWKIVMIYCLLVFIAITIIGVSIMRNFEDYYINSVRSNLTNTVQGSTLVSLSGINDLESHRSDIQRHIDSAWAWAIQEEIFIIDSNMQIIASNTESINNAEIDRLDIDAILRAVVLGENAMSRTTVTWQQTVIPIMNLAFPIVHNDEIIGVVYVRTDMSTIYETISRANRIFINAIPFALLVTILMGILISKTITVPIQEITQKAAVMAEGDFSQEIDAKSKDEIGQLALMFNQLRIQLSDNISAIGNEKSKLETILRYMADGLVAVDLSGRIIHANQTAMRTLKIRPEDIENATYDEIVRNFNDELVLEVLLEKCETEAVAETFSASGATYALRYDRFKDEKGADIGIIMIIQDITEQQKMENMQTDFVANVSHELKTPLTTIKSYAETLLEGALSEEATAKDFISIIDTEADRMSRLVKELLQLSRLDYKQEKWFKKEMNLIPILKKCVVNVELLAKEKNQHLNCIFTQDEIRVVMDRDGIEQVILNILSNSIKYTREGGRVDIDAFVTGKKAHIVIADNGIGIPESEISRVFERFFRVDRARSRSMGGTGLGLAISKQIVEDHDGTIEIASREGRGTNVTVTLPAAVTRGVRGIE